MDPSASIVNEYYGTALIGIFLGLILYGITIQQFFYYFSTAPAEDRWPIKTWVTTLAIIETGYMATCMGWIYSALVNDFGHPERLVVASWSMALYVSLMGVMIASVQMFFAWRIFALARARWIVALILLCTVVNLGSSIAAGVLSGIIYPNFVDHVKLTPVAVVWSVSVSVCDLAITSTLTWYFYTQRKHLLSKTDMIIDSILRLTVQNALLTTIGQFCTLIVFLAKPGGTFRIFYFFTPMLFVSGALASLNARSDWRRRDKDGPAAISLDIRFKRPNASAAEGTIGSTHSRITTTAADIAVDESHEVGNRKDSRVAPWEDGQSSVKDMPRHGTRNASEA